MGPFSVLISVLAMLASGQLDFDQTPTLSSDYLPPPQSYLPPARTYLPPSKKYLPPPVGKEDMKVIFYEDDHFKNKAQEPGFCSTYCASVPDVIVEKPGRCPAVPAGPVHGLCQTDCKYDSECPGRQRCCSNGCANICMEPDFRRLCIDIICPSDHVCVEHKLRDAECVDPTPKPGLCPAVADNTFPMGGCQDMCQYDAECDGDAKCCFNGCANRCLKPREPDCETIRCKVGYKCEEDKYGEPVCEPVPCKQDGEVIDIECNSCTCLHGFLLCSQEDCPPTKPGFCPRLVKGYKGKCVESCMEDYNCPDRLKCCNTGCGHTCQKPREEIVHPCNTVRFRCGDNTRCAATRGFCYPGKPCPLVPLCVSNKAPFCASCPEGKVCVLQQRSCRGLGVCHRQPICIQLYKDDTPFEENEDLELAIVVKQAGIEAK